MASLWSWSDKKHRVRIPAGKWTRLTFITIDGTKHVGGSVSKETQDTTVQGQLYTGVTRGTDFISVRFGRVFKDGRPTDYTGYQDIKAPETKRTFNLAPIWIGDLSPDYTFVIEVRCTKPFTMGNRIYKGVR